MKIFKYLLIMGIIFSLSGFGYAADVESEREDENSGEKSSVSPVLTGALMGGLLGGGVGAAIGSASGKAGTGALIGAGVGAAGGSLIGASQEDKQRREEGSYAEPKAPAGAKVKKKVIREYDDQGNLLSEKEVQGTSSK